MNPRHIPRSPVTVVPLLLLAAFSAAAADPEIDPIVVTATRVATRANELMSDVTVIGPEEIEQAGQSTIEQLLTRQGGIQFSSNGGPGTNSGIYIRGTNANQSIVLIDGQRIGSATSGTAALSRIPLSQVERIEILRGPASSLYGADAIGGVVQIFTRRGAGPAQFNASTGFGTYGTSDSSVGVSGGTDRVSYSVQAGYYDTDGFNALNNPKNYNYNADRDGYRDGSLTGNFAFRPAQGHEIGVNLFASDGTSQYDYSPRAFSYKNEQDVSTASIYSRNAFTRIWTSTLRVGHSSDDSTAVREKTEISQFRTDQDQASWQNDLKLPFGTVLLAAEYLKQEVSGTTDYTVSERTIRSLLGGWTGNFDDHRFQFNIRRDQNSQFGGETTGAVSYGYQISPDLRAHVSYGTAFRAPTFNELYYPGYGNTDLQAETSRNTEAGFNWDRGSHRFSAVVYHNVVSDLIQNGPAPSYAPANISEALLRGATLSYDGRFSDWATGVTIDFLDSSNEGEGPNHGNRLVRRASSQMSSYLSRTFGNLDLRGEWQLVGERYDNPANTLALGGYGLVNLYADYRFEKGWHLFARGNNIFNKKYETASDYATAGANFFVGVRYSPQ